VELEVVHPLTAQWLTENGYKHKHEARLPEYGRADFVATSNDNSRLVVECKPKLDHRTRAHIMQLLGYCHREVQGALAAPEDAVSDIAKELCLEYGILLILLKVRKDRPISDPKDYLKDLNPDILKHDRRPLPLIIADQCQFKLSCQEIDGTNYYCIQDWIQGIVGSIPSRIWSDLKRNLGNKFLRKLSIQPIPYKAINGKTYKLSFTDDKGLYLITQHLRETKSRPTLAAIRRFLAECSAIYSPSNTS
jgi:hypothetical protein